MLDKMDSDGDKTISIAEATAAFDKVTAGLPASMTAPLWEKAKGMFAASDKDGNGKVDVVELHAAVEANKHDKDA